MAWLSSSISDGGSREAIDIKTRRVEAILEEVSLTLQRLDIEKAMEDARLHLQAQLLRDAFHGTLSHELCSPLATIQGSASVLESMPAIRETDQIHSLVEAISDEVAELDGYHSKPAQRNAGYRRRRQPAPRVGGSARHRQRGHQATSPTIGGAQGRDRIRRRLAADQCRFRSDRGGVRAASRKCGQIFSVRLNDLDRRADRTRTRHFVDFRSRRRDNAGRTAATWPQVIPKPASSSHQSRGPVWASGSHPSLSAQMLEPSTSRAGGRDREQRLPLRCPAPKMKTFELTAFANE